MKLYETSKFGRPRVKGLESLPVLLTGRMESPNNTPSLLFYTF